MRRLLLAVVAGGCASAIGGEPETAARRPSPQGSRAAAKQPPEEPKADLRPGEARGVAPLSPALRKEIWSSLTRASALAAYETWHRFRDRVDPKAAIRSALDGDDPLRLQVSYQEALEKATRPLLARYEIDEAQRDSIWQEGVEKGWAAVFVPDPGPHATAETIIKAELAVGSWNPVAAGSSSPPSRPRRR